MAFEGNIEDFGVADVLQLINSQGKTGVLTFQSKKEVISIGFENGMISSASHNKKGVMKPIGDYLVLTGRISKEDLKKFDSKSKKKGVPVIDTLVENNILTKEDLEKIIEFKIQEIVDELFTWKKGEYKFQLGERLYSKSKYSVLVNPQFLILEGIRRIDEWPKIKEAIPDYKTVFRKKKKPSLSVEMGEQEKITLGLIDGKTCVDDIVALSGLGKFRTYHALYNLLESGGIEKTSLVAEPIQREKKLFPALLSDVYNLVLWVIVILFLVVNIILGITFRPFYKINRSIYKKSSHNIEEFREKRLREIQFAYWIIKGKIPESDSEVKKEE
jgi:hypothetical protein